VEYTYSYLYVLTVLVVVVVVVVDNVGCRGPRGIGKKG